MQEAPDVEFGAANPRIVHTMCTIFHIDPGLGKKLLLVLILRVSPIWTLCTVCRCMRAVREERWSGVSCAVPHARTHARARARANLKKII